MREIAKQLKLDMVQFEKDRNDPAIAGKVRADMRDGNKAGVRGVPTVFINGRGLCKVINTLVEFAHIFAKT